MTDLQSADASTGVDRSRWIGGEDVLDAELPADVQTTMSGFLGADVTTLGDWVAALRTLIGGSISVEELCHADSETPHSAQMDGETYHFQCFYDAIALSRLRDESVDVRTQSPDGEVVEARVTGDVIHTTPSDAVTSFGVRSNVPASGDDGPSIGEVYGAVCPYVKAFPDRAAYAEWASDVDAATVALPLADGMPIAGALVE
jgi:alkylmercury lyase